VISREYALHFAWCLSTIITQMITPSSSARSMQVESVDKESSVRKPKRQRSAVENRPIVPTDLFESVRALSDARPDVRASPRAKRIVIDSCPDSVTFPINKDPVAPPKDPSMTECIEAIVCPAMRATNTGSGLARSANKKRVSVKKQKERKGRTLWLGANPNATARPHARRKKNRGASKLE